MKFINLLNLVFDQEKLKDIILLHSRFVNQGTKKLKHNNFEKWHLLKNKKEGPFHYLKLLLMLK